MVMPLAVRRFTVDDLDALPEDGNRHELLDGILLVTPAPGPPHQTVAMRLAARLSTFLEAEPGLRVWALGGTTSASTGWRWRFPAPALDSTIVTTNGTRTWNSA